MSDENRSRWAVASIRRRGADIPRTSQPALRCGLTLIEVMLVLTVMAVIAAFAWPAINKAFSNQRLQKAADVVRTQWCKSRVKAMSNDQIVLFRYETNGSRFRLEQLSDTASSENFSNGGTTQSMEATPNAEGSIDPSTTSAGGVAPNTNSVANGSEQSLPEGIVFRGCEIENDSRAMTAVANPSSVSTEVVWSDPIYFYPDGTSSNARLQIGNDQNRAIELMLRGMTGVVKVGDIIEAGGVMP